LISDPCASAVYGIRLSSTAARKMLVFMFINNEE